MSDESDVVVRAVLETSVYLNDHDEVVILQKDFYEEKFVWFPKEAALVVAARIIEIAENE